MGKRDFIRSMGIALVVVGLDLTHWATITAGITGLVLMGISGMVDE